MKKYYIKYQIDGLEQIFSSGPFDEKNVDAHLFDIRGFEGVHSVFLAPVNENKEKEDKMKFAYFRDPENPRRVLTIARKVEYFPDITILTIGYSVNNPSDHFSKKQGRIRAVGKCSRPGPTLAIKASDNRYLAALELLIDYEKETNSKNGYESHALRIAKHHLEKELSNA